MKERRSGPLAGDPEERDYGRDAGGRRDEDDEEGQWRGGSGEEMIEKNRIGEGRRGGEAAGGAAVEDLRGREPAKGTRT